MRRDLVMLVYAYRFLSSSAKRESEAFFQLCACECSSFSKNFATFLASKKIENAWDAVEIGSFNGSVLGEEEPDDAMGGEFDEASQSTRRPRRKNKHENGEQRDPKKSKQ